MTPPLNGVINIGVRFLQLTSHHELAQLLSSQKKGSRVPIVALTGNIDDREIALQTGMDEHIPKPFSLNKIYDAVDRFCGKSVADSPAERRLQPRHAIENDEVIICNGNLGQVVNISSSGLAIKYTTHESIANEWRAVIVNKTKKVSTPYLLLKLVRKNDIVPSSSSCPKTEIIGATFHDPDENLQNQIQQFMCQTS